MSKRIICSIDRGATETAIFMSDDISLTGSGVLRYNRAASFEGKHQSQWEGLDPPVASL